MHLVVRGQGNFQDLISGHPGTINNLDARKEEHYWTARQSLRVWPISGPDLGQAFREFCVDKLLLELSVADVKMEIPVLVRSLKSSILSSTSFQMVETFWGVGSAAVGQSRRKANMVAQGDGKFGP